MKLENLPAADNPKLYLPLLALLLGVVFLLTIQQSAVLFIGAVGLSAILIYLCLTDFEIDYYHLVIVMLFSSIIFPAIIMPGGIPDVRVEEFIIYAFFPILLLMSSKKWQVDRYGKYFIGTFILYLLWMSVSTLYGNIALSVPITMGDLFNFFTIGKYLLLFFIVYQISFDEKQLEQLLYFFIYFLILSGFIGVLQFYGVMGLDSILGPIYNPGRPYIVRQRLIGTFFNPNTYSFVLTIGISIVTCLLFYEEALKRRIFLFATFFLFIYFILITGSRTGLGSLLAVLVSITFYNAYKRGYNIFKIISVMVISLAVIGALFTLVTQKQMIRYVSGINLTRDTSLLMRIILWYLNFQIFIESPIIGWGPAEAIHAKIVDNEYLLIARRYGLIGLGINLFLYFIPVRYAFKKYKKGNTIYDVWSQVIIFSTLSFLIGNITNPLFHYLQAMDIWFLLIGIFFSAKSREYRLYENK